MLIAGTPLRHRHDPRREPPEPDHRQIDDGVDAVVLQLLQPANCSVLDGFLVPFRRRLLDLGTEHEDVLVHEGRAEVAPSTGPRTVLTASCSPLHLRIGRAYPSRSLGSVSYRRAAGPALGPRLCAVAGSQARGIREHRYSFEMPHAAPRIWALFQDYDRWTDYAPMVRRVEVIYPGDEHHNGRLRRVIFKMPLDARDRRSSWSPTWSPTAATPTR